MAATALPTRPLGKAEVCTFGLGGASLGDLYAKIPSVQALQTVEAAHQAGFRYFDTSPWYGLGLSEVRMGLALSAFPRDSYAVSTKVGRTLHPHRDEATWSSLSWAGGLQNSIEYAYGHDDVIQQHRESLLRLGVGRVEALVIHDMEEAESQAPGTHRRGTRGHLAGTAAGGRPGGYAALEGLRRSGTVKAIGAGVNYAIGTANHTADTYRAWNVNYVDFLLSLKGEGERPIDFLLLAGCYNMLELSAWTDGILQRCIDNGVSVVVGGAFATGILATGAVDGAKYNYEDASPRVLAKVAAMEAVCREFEVALAAVALQFPLGHPAVASVIPGCKSVPEVTRCAEMVSTVVPPALWDRLKEESLLPRDVPTPS